MIRRITLAIALALASVSSFAQNNTQAPVIGQASGDSLPSQAGNSGKFLSTDGSVTLWSTPAGSGNVTGQASSIDGEAALFSGTTGKIIKRSALTGVIKQTSGVVSTAAYSDVVALWSGCSAGVLFFDGTCAAVVSDTAYNATSWDGVTAIAPSKNAVRDQVETMLSSISGTVSDTAYDATTWNGDTTHAPSKNAVRDKIEALASPSSLTGATCTFSESSGVWTTACPLESTATGADEVTAQANPGSNPATSGHAYRWVDSTSKTLKTRYSDGTQTTTVIADTGAANNFISAISADGVITKSQPTGAGLSMSDVTTNDVSTSKHGFAPKAPNDATKFLNGTGAWSVPSGSSGPGMAIVLRNYANHSPGAATTYFVGESAVASSVFANVMSYTVPKACTVTRVTYWMHNNGGTQGAGETVAATFNLLLNSTTGSDGTTFGSTSIAGTMSPNTGTKSTATGLSQSLAVGDTLLIKIGPRTATTQPTNVWYEALAYCE